jgi:enolase-phosphatase E1
MNTLALVTDIEGTTSSLEFVHSILFPYSLSALESFLERRSHELQVREVCLEILQDSVFASDTSPEKLSKETLDRIIKQVQDWIAADKKITSLKRLQGLIWEEGYQRGLIKGHLYKDAVEGLRRWHTSGIKLYVYSSGSVQAQKLLFQFSDFGDLTPLFSGYFDTTTGNKRESNSYKSILNHLNLSGKNVVFLSDIALELEAAHNAEMQCVHVVRSDGDNGAHQDDRFPVAADFGMVDTFL